MDPLRFVDWSGVNQLFCVIMWLLVIILVAAILVGSNPASAPRHRPPATYMRH